MKFFIIEGVLVDPCPVDRSTLEQAIRAHVEYLEKGFDEGSILVSGPKAQGGGGFIVMKANSEDSVFNYLEQDPMKVAGVQNYIVTEFIPHNPLPAVSEWFLG